MKESRVEKIVHLAQQILSELRDGEFTAQEIEFNKYTINILTKAVNLPTHKVDKPGHA